MNDASPKRRPRISLLSLLLLTGLIASWLTVAMLWREVGPLRAEVLNLREETGQLSVEDPSKCYLVPIDTHIDDVWQYRMWIPEGSRYRLEYAHWKIPIEGIPPESTWNTKNYSGLYKPGEYLVTIKMDEIDRRKHDMLDLYVKIEAVGHSPSWGPGEGPSASGGVSTGIQEFGPDDWIIHDESGERCYSPETLEKRSSYEVSERVPLFKVRADAMESVEGGAWRRVKPAGPRPGMMFWLEPLPEPTTDP